LQGKYGVGVLDHIKNSSSGIKSVDDAPIAASPVHDLRLSEPNEINKFSGWDVDFRQIEPGPMDTRLVVRPSQNVTLLEVRMDRAVHQQGCSPGDTVTLGLPTSPALQSWHGADVEWPVLLNFGRATAFECVSGPAFTALTVSIAKPFLERVADRIGLPLLNELQGTRSLPVRQRSEALNRVAESGMSLLYDCETRFGESEQEDFVAELICAAADSEKPKDRSASSSRAKSVSLALDYMAENASNGISVCEICAAAGVSKSTLERGFREQFGIGPKAYLNRFRLVQARSDLLHRRAGARVADAANAWGFWHMGQFAKDYHLMFGELPSGTLKTQIR